jgi:DNA-binding CsgD family transcriptional regulator
VGAVEHLKTLCCLGLPPESAMVAVTPLLHEIIPHGWSRANLFKSYPTSDGEFPALAPLGHGYSDNPAAPALIRERAWAFSNDPTSPLSLILRDAFRAAGIGWSLHRQGRGWLESAWYQELEAPLDSCWVLDAMIGDQGRSIALIQLTRPRSARPFRADDVQCLDRLRPWLAHAFRRQAAGNTILDDGASNSTAGITLLSGQLILTPDAAPIHQTVGLELLLRILSGELVHLTRPVRTGSMLPAPVLQLLRRIVGAANGSFGDPPRVQVSTAYGVITLEAKWLVPAGAIPEDVAKDPKSCLISVMVELREHVLAHAARVLRESGATPAQVKIGIKLAMGKTKSVIADELGIKLSSVADQTQRLYQTLDIHNSTELSTKIWLSHKPCGTLPIGSPRSGFRSNPFAC